MSEQPMTSNKPYLIRALHEWISDNHCTPYLYINTADQRLVLPTNLLAENPLVLNISANACKDLSIGEVAINFQTRFSGQITSVYIPIEAVMAIVARENGQGMTFELAPLDESATDQATAKESAERKSSLKVIK